MNAWYTEHNTEHNRELHIVQPRSEDELNTTDLHGMYFIHIHSTTIVQTTVYTTQIVCDSSAATKPSLANQSAGYT